VIVLVCFINFQSAGQQSVRWTLGILHVFKFSGLRLDAVKAALSRSACQRVTGAASPLDGGPIIKQRVAVES
jgi:hypothetical protein